MAASDGIAKLGIVVTIGMGLATIGTMLKIHGDQSEQWKQEQTEIISDQRPDLIHDGVTFDEDGHLVVMFRNPSRSQPMTVSYFVFRIREEEALEKIRPIYPPPGPNEFPAYRNPYHADLVKRDSCGWANNREFVFYVDTRMSVPPASGEELTLRLSDPKLAGLTLEGDLYAQSWGGEIRSEHINNFFVTVQDK